MEQKQKRKRSKRYDSGIIVLSLIFTIGAFVGIVSYDTGFQAGAQTVPLVVTATVTYTPSPSPTITIEPTESPRCAMVWTYAVVPEKHMIAMRTALDNAGYEDATLKAIAYGEDEGCYVDGEVVSSRFLLMDFTPTITFDVSAETFADDNAKGNMVRDVVTLLQNIEDLPRINHVKVFFMSGEEFIEWQANQYDIPELLETHEADDALFNAGVVIRD